MQQLNESKRREKKKRMFSQNPNRSKLSEMPIVEVCVCVETSLSL